MGLSRSILYSGLYAGVALLAAVPAFAQQQGNGSDPVFNLPGGSARPQDNPRQQGPELDVFRDPAPTVNTPPVVIPPPQPQQQPAPRPNQPAAARPAETQSQPRATTPARPTPEPRRPEPTAQRAPEPQPEPVRDEPAPAPSQPEATPQPAPTVTPAAPEPTPAPTSDQPAGAPLWPWVAGGLVLLAGLLAFLFRRRRVAPVEVAPPVQDSVPSPSPVRETPPAPAPTPPVAPPPVPGPASERPWLEIALAVRTARLSLMGATVGYTLTIHNRGEATAEDVLVRALIANADGGQQTAIQRFFGGEAGLPLHSVVSIAPGESQWLEGEVRLDAGEIAPVQMGQRALLVPLVAIDAQYRWAGEGGDLIGAGRTARAFIIGQEQQPPTERLSPFRLDMGPRQYRDAASRATALALSS